MTISVRRCIRLLPIAIAIAALSGCSNSSTETSKSESSGAPGSVAATQRPKKESAPDKAATKVEPSSVTDDTADKGKAKPTPKISGDAFRMAAYEGRLDSVRSAIESGMDINLADPTRSLTALHMAAYNGHTETVNYLIKQGATVDCRDSEGKTPLIHACTGPFAKAAEALIGAGADIDARDSTEGFTPLMMAAGLGQTEVVEVLLKHQADKTLVDNDNESAADHARNSGHDEIVALLK
jgi:ankyrin repeat protein